MRPFLNIRTILMAATSLGGLVLASQPVHAQDAGQMQSIQRQIQGLQEQLRRMQRDAAARDQQLQAAQDQAAKANAAAQAAQASAATVQQQAQAIVDGSSAAPLVSVGHGGQFRIGGVTVTLGGFLAAEGVYRSRNQTGDIGSNFNTSIPLGNTAQYREPELRGSARQSRVSLLMQAQPDASTKLAGYFETDFLGTGPSANSVESNSYTLRIRQAYATYDRTDWGFHFLGGQSWSLLTLDKIGITPRSENIPLTIDAQYVPGFTWTRNMQLRFVKDFGPVASLGVSFESPQTNYFVGPNGTGVNNGGVVNAFNGGGPLLVPTQNYSDDIAPDMVVKAAFDPGYGHYEIYGVGRLMQDRVSYTGAGHNAIMAAGGAGAAAILPIVPGVLDFQISGLAGVGIGRYGSAQLPDATIGQNGDPKPLPEVMVLGGLIGHPAKSLDVYGYVGGESVSGRSYGIKGKGYGYGSALYSNGGCSIELSSACNPNTSSVVQGTTGVWWRFLQGDYGTMQMGAQYSYTRRNLFDATNSAGTVSHSPSSDEHMALISFRYLPFAAP